MSNIRASCIGQSMRFTNTPTISSGDVNYDTITFDFCSQWDNFTKTAVFYRSEKDVYYQLLDENNTCFIPKEVLVDKGTIYIGVFGVAGETTITSQVLGYRIDKGAITENLKPSDPTPDIYEQIISQYDFFYTMLEEHSNKLEELAEEITKGVGDANTLSGHEAEYFASQEDLKQYLPLSGGTLTSRRLGLFNGLGEVYADENGVNMATKNNGSITSRTLILFNSDLISGVNTALRLRDRADSVDTDYIVLHSSNYSNYAVPLNGSKAMTGNLNISNANGSMAFMTSTSGIGLMDTSTTKWMFRKFGGVYYVDDDKKILHSGNSKPVVISDTAPSDTTALWVVTE